MQAKELKSKYTGVSSDAMRSRSGGGGGMGGGGPSHRYYDDDDEDDVYASSGRRVEPLHGHSVTAFVVDLGTQCSISVKL